MPAVGAAAVSCVITFPEWSAVKRAVLLAETPAVAKIILRSRSPQARLLFAVDKEQVIAFTVPPGGREINALHGAHVMPPPLNVGDQIIPPHDTGELLPVHRVEISAILRQRRQLLPVDVIVECITWLVAFIAHDDAGRFFERHRPIAVPAAAVRTDADRQRCE